MVILDHATTWVATWLSLPYPTWSGENVAENVTEDPINCVYLSGEDVAGNVNEEAVRDEGTGKRKRYANTS
eukprot:7929920-Heterocapsa_arctica.AAC.1